MIRAPIQTARQRALQSEYRTSLTFGVEVEFFAAIKRSTFQTVAHHSIAGLLGTRLRKLRLFGPEGVGSAFKVVSDFDYDPVHERTVDYTCWNLTTDDIAGPGHPEWFSQYESQSIELISPPYWVHSPHWEHDIQRIFSSRQGQFNPIPARELRLYSELNGSTSLHIHVGNGVEANSAFSFDNVLNIAMILLIYEPKMDKLLNGELYTNHATNYHKPPRCISSVHSEFFQPPNLSPDAPRTIMALHLLNSCSDIKSIVEAMNPPLKVTNGHYRRHFFKYNFTPLLDSLDVPRHGHESGNQSQRRFPIAKRKSPTVEFRQQPGTLDPDTMVHWINFIGALVDLATKVPRRPLIEFLGLEDLDVDYDSMRKEAESPENQRPNLNPDTFTPNPSNSPSSLSAFSLLSGLQPIGSLSRLLTAMETVHIPVDSETIRYWRRKIDS